MTKRRTKIISYQEDAPQFQYKDASTGYWVDAPWFVLTFQELRAYLHGKGIHQYHIQTRKIESYREARYL